MFIGITEYLSANASEALIRVLQVISFFAESYMSVVVIGIVYWCVSKRKGQYLALTVCAGVGLNGFFKNIFCETRPFVASSKVINHRPSTATGYSFPSGHTQNASVMGGTLSIIIKKRAVTVIFVAYSLLIALSRLILGAHYINDVVASLIIGWGVAVLSAVFFDKHNERRDMDWVLWYLVPAALCAIPLFRSIAQREDALNAIGLTIGVVFGIIVENKYIGFSDAQGVKNRILRFVVGIVITLAIMLGLKLLCGDINMLRVPRYACVGFAATALAPYVFKKLKL